MTGEEIAEEGSAAASGHARHARDPRAQALSLIGMPDASMIVPGERCLQSAVPSLSSPPSSSRRVRRTHRPRSTRQPRV